MRALITFLTCSLVAASSAMAQSRGELLYTTHCIACHTTEMRSRDKRPARSGGSAAAGAGRCRLVAPGSRHLD